jgi:serine/threonine-protein kinase RsbW
VARRGGADDATLTRLQLAVTEAATNVVLHAYRGPAQEGDIHTTARVIRQELEVTIRDHGVGMSPHPDSPGLGLGLSLMAHEAESCEISTPPSGGTEVRMRFALPENCGVAAGSLAHADPADACATR